MCVCEREREREIESESECVCVRERERENERERESETILAPVCIQIAFTILAPVCMQITLQVLNRNTCGFEVLHQTSRVSMSVCLVQNSSFLLPSAHELKFSLIFFAPLR